MIEVLSATDRADDDATSRLIPLVGDEGIARLRDSRVVVVGLGGVGSACAEALARGGVGHLVLVDRDAVSESNINRQALAFRSTVGKRKVDVMAAMVAEINPDCTVETHDIFLREADVTEWLESIGPCDYLVDAIDTISTKLALARAVRDRGIRAISGMGAANKLHPESLRVADLYDTVNCPVCRIMRKEGRKRGIEALQVVYSREQPVETSARSGAERSERSDLGTMSYMPPIMGQMIAGVVIRQLAGIEPLYGADDCAKERP